MDGLDFDNLDEEDDADSLKESELEILSEIYPSFRHDQYGYSYKARLPVVAFSHS